MMDTDTQILTVEQCETLQRHYLWSKLNDRPATISDTMFEPDGRRRGRVIKDAVTSGFLRPFGNDLWDGKTYEVTPEVMATVVPKLPHLLQMWAELHEKNSHREAYSRPWIRFEDLSIDDQFGVIDSDSVDWFVISTIPYQYQAQFASEHETVLANVPNGQSHNRYWAGPFASLNLANEHKTGKPSLGIAVSSSELRVAVAERFSEAKLQRTFAANLLWGLVTMNIVPKDLVFDPDGKPTVDTQLVEGHAFRLSADIDPPVRRGDVKWEGNVTESIERIKSRIEKLESTLEKLRQIDRGVQAFGGWAEFMHAIEGRLRQKTEP